MGRTRTFDTTEALDKALLVFWRQGYDGTSLTDLTDAIGVERPSLYAAFGNKQRIFERVLERYGESPWSYLDGVLGLPKIQDVVEGVLNGAAELHTRPGTPAGCLEVQAALVSGDAAEVARTATAQSRQEGEVRLRERLERAVEEGELSSQVRPKELAFYLQSLVYGMAVQAASGATRKDLDRVVARTLDAFWAFTRDSPAEPVRQRRGGRRRAPSATKEDTGAAAR